MRISDWSSDVCSSDLGARRGWLDRSADTRRAVRLCGSRFSRPRAAPARLAVGTRGVPVPGAVRLAVLRGVPRWQPAVRPDQRRVPGCRLHARLLRLLDALVHGLGDHRLPGFALLARHLARETARQPIKRLSPVRRWLTYLTLFLAAVALICDVTTLVYSLLGGELSVRFVLKVLVVGLIAGGVFGYYLWDLRREEVEP